MPKKDNTFLLVSLEEDKARKLANVIGSDTSRKILDFLVKKSATETEISKELQIPISTVHYNLKQLSQAGLVKADEFHYSEKGREVDHYSIANKYIIIAPKATESLANKLKRILPVFGFVAATGIAVQIFSVFQQSSFTSSVATGASRKAVEDSSAAGAPLAATTTESALQNASAMIPMDKAIAETGIQTAQQPSIALWFVLGALFALVVYLIYDLVKERLR